MIRKVIYFTSPQHAWLEEDARKRGITVGDLVRRLVDQGRDVAEKEKERSTPAEKS